jgi:hypothetical protein
MRTPLRAVVSALSLLVVAAGTVMSATPAQASDYWALKNSHTGTCLTGGSASNGTASVYVTTCNGSYYQQWHYLPLDGDTNDYHQLQNLATGLCLRTDHKTTVNAVWNTTCSKSSQPSDDQLWHHDYSSSGGLYSRYWYGGHLRTSDRVGAVYSDQLDNRPEIPWSYYAWWRN